MITRLSLRDNKLLKRFTLVGPMGAGKSTIGRLLSKELDLLFIDSDREIEVRTGATISWIFDVEGEQGFREREQNVIAEICNNEQGFVLATGGGAILCEATRKLLAEQTTVIYLYASVEQQIARTAKDKHRPLLQVPEPEKILQQLMAIRDPLYREIAHHVIITDERPPRFLIQHILEILGL